MSWESARKWRVKHKTQGVGEVGPHHQRNEWCSGQLQSNRECVCTWSRSLGERRLSRWRFSHHPRQTTPFGPIGLDSMLRRDKDEEATLVLTSKRERAMGKNFPTSCQSLVCFNIFRVIHTQHCQSCCCGWLPAGAGNPFFYLMDFSIFTTSNPLVGEPCSSCLDNSAYFTEEILNWRSGI